MDATLVAEGTITVPEKSHALERLADSTTEHARAAWERVPDTHLRKLSDRVHAWHALAIAAGADETEVNRARESGKAAAHATR